MFVVCVEMFLLLLMRFDQSFLFVWCYIFSCYYWWDWSIVFVRLMLHALVFKGPSANMTLHSTIARGQNWFLASLCMGQDSRMCPGFCGAVHHRQSGVYGSPRSYRLKRKMQCLVSSADPEVRVRWECNRWCFWSPDGGLYIWIQTWCASWSDLCPLCRKCSVGLPDLPQRPAYSSPLSTVSRAPWDGDLTVVWQVTKETICVSVQLLYGWLQAFYSRLTVWKINEDDMGGRWCLKQPATERAFFFFIAKTDVNPVSAVSDNCTRRPVAVIMSPRWCVVVLIQHFHCAVLQGCILLIALALQWRRAHNFCVWYLRLSSISPPPPLSLSLPPPPPPPPVGSRQDGWAGSHQLVLWEPFEMLVGRISSQSFKLLAMDDFLSRRWRREGSPVSVSSHLHQQQQHDHHDHHHGCVSSYRWPRKPGP